MLRSTDGGIPIIGEIKVKKDMDVFFGLVQALMYGVELATPNQFARLRKSYPEQFADLPDRPQFDVYLLLADHPSDPLHADIMASTQYLVKEMYKENTLSSLVRRIACLSVGSGPEDGLGLSAHFVFGK
ncbi:MAG: hypothetical protein K2R98_02610 [Gemmataceae bacterium]|nr:hypothetical protein [Gemmataceae bacterium]